jgi:hypothetical protein
MTAWERGSVIFHRPDELEASAAVSGTWERPLARLVIECWKETGFGGNSVDLAVGEFVGWCFKQSPPPGTMIGVYNLPGLPWPGADDHDPFDWYDRVMAEVAGWDPPPVLVDLDGLLITHRGKVLAPPRDRRRAPRTDRRSRPPGAPFPVGWFGTDLGVYRPCRSTYECYAPEELPPIRVPLDGTFGWLRSAPEHEHHIGGDPERTAAALDRLLAANPAGLPREFVAFFRSPDLWRRIRSCTDCYLNLDPAAVGIRDGSGALVRFLSDSQYCRHWNLCLTPGGAGHSVVATYFYSGSEHPHPRAGRPHPRDITTVAGSFEEFVYRFWLENELFFAVHGREQAEVRDLLPGGHAIGGRMPEGGREYLAFYRPEARGAEPGRGGSS